MKLYGTSINNDIRVSKYIKHAKTNNVAFHILGIYSSPVFSFTALTFKNRGSYMSDGHTAALQMLDFTYFFSKYKY